MNQTINEIEINGAKYVLKSENTIVPKGENEISWNNENWIRKSTISNLADKVDEMPFVLIRGYSSGVQYGYLKSRNGCEVELLNSRRIWAWEGATETNQIAVSGIKESSSKVTVIIPYKIVTDVIEVEFITVEAAKNLINQSVWKK